MMSRGSVIPVFLKIKNNIFPVTDEKMTRFSITLDESVEMAIKALEYSSGGEIFIPKLKSYKIVDIVEAISKNGKIKNIGIRPGEKIHEELITKGETADIFSYKDFYIISSQTKKDLSGYKKIQKNFSYNSNNSGFYNVKELKKIIYDELKKLKMIPYARPRILKQDIINVNKVLKSQYLTTGPEILRFEKKLSSLCKSKYAMTCNSATSALHLCCLALGLSKNDCVWTSSITFVASANCALYCGAKIQLIDIDPDTLNISIEKLEKKLIQARYNNKLPKIIIPVHLGGNPCEMKKLKNLSKKYKFKIIEDASHAIGASYNGSLVGSCAHSDACVFSFHPVKIITTGEGGAMLTNNKDLALKFSALRNHGIERRKLLNKSHYDWYYEQRSLGYNYRMNDIEASLGSSQLNKLKKIIKERNEIANYYKKFESKNIRFQKVDNYQNPLITCSL